MTRMLASVTDVAEAESAVRAGADIIDVKDPSQGALGAVAIAGIQAIVRCVDGRRPVSATIGDLPANPDLLTGAIREMGATGVDYVKVGFFTNENIDACLAGISALTADQAVVAVLFADRSPPLGDLARFAAAGFVGVMLDTADKVHGGLLEYASPTALRRFVDAARSLGLLTGLAGSLGLGDIPALLPLSPDYLGFRGALCREAQRTQKIDPYRLRSVRQAIGSA
jgi:uncharacterized protein (UPF0264 family)